MIEQPHAAPRAAPFDKKTPMIGDACTFQLSPTHRRRRGTVTGRTVIKRLFDVRDEAGNLHQNITDVWLDHEDTADRAQVS